MNIKQKIQSLDLPENSFVVVGSGIMGALGIRESNDIDMIISQEVFDDLERKGWDHDNWPDQIVLKNDVFDLGVHWMNEKVEDLIKKATIIDDIPYLSLTDLLTWKIARSRPKDILDVQLINDYLNENPDKKF